MPDLGECKWFLNCHNPAAETIPHPILGPVPACQRCIDALDLKNQ